MLKVAPVVVDAGLSKVTMELAGEETTLHEVIKLIGRGSPSSVTLARRRTPTPWGIEMLDGMARVMTGAVFG